MLVLERKGDEVYFGNQKLTIVKQATKGPGKEVVKIKGLEGSNGQQWLSLSRLAEGRNEIECQGREVTTTSRYTLTAEEAKRVKELQDELDAIIAQAKARYVKKPNLDIDPSKMSEAERLAKIEELKKYYGLK
jgi:hypothetical protein